MDDREAAMLAIFRALPKAEQDALVTLLAGKLKPEPDDQIPETEPERKS